MTSVGEGSWCWSSSSYAAGSANAGDMGFRSNICARFQGKVFEVPAETEVQPGQFLLSERQGESGAVVRLLCDVPPVDGAEVTPGLEDAFLAIYREGTE